VDKTPVYLVTPDSHWHNLVQIRKIEAMLKECGEQPINKTNMPLKTLITKSIDKQGKRV
jgi:hypothetical protein